MPDQTENYGFILPFPDDFYNVTDSNVNFMQIDELIKTAYDGLAGKVDAVEGKGLSTEDYTTEEKRKLAGVEEGATKYTHPATHPADMITGLGDAATKNVGTVAGTVAAGDHGHTDFQPKITDSLNLGPMKIRWDGTSNALLFEKVENENGWIVW